MARSLSALAVIVVMLVSAGPAHAKRAQQPPPAPPADQAVQQSPNYIVGPQDVLIITSYDQPELTAPLIVAAFIPLALVGPLLDCRGSRSPRLSL